MAREIISMIGKEQWDEAFKFTVVRNPWSKVVSHYQYRKRYNAQLKKYPLSFTDWVRKTYGLHKDSFYVNNLKLFQSQINWIKDFKGRIAVDKIIRFEEIEKGFDEIAARLEINKKLPHLNKTNHTDYKLMYDEESREIVGNRFKSDIIEFGYEF